MKLENPALAGFFLERHKNIIGRRAAESGRPCYQTGQAANGEARYLPSSLRTAAVELPTLSTARSNSSSLTSRCRHRYFT
jgi:hypothetical protein